MRFTQLNSILKTAILAVAGLLITSSVSFAQQQVNLTAAPTTATLPDGSTVPMWGYSCTGTTTIANSTATCAPLNPNANGGWSPVVITIPSGTAGGLQINFTNNLSFTPAGSSTPNNIPTSLTIVGQIGGGLGSAPTTTPSPVHPPQTVTWPVANIPNVDNVPPPQEPRVQSFATEVAAGTTATLTWKFLRPGTYLLESGTHPSIQGPMGLYGILVVTSTPTSIARGTAYPGIAYDAEVPLLFSEIDPVQNNLVNAAVLTSGFSETATIQRSSTPGPIVALNLLNGGKGYIVGDAISFSAPGSGASASVTAVDGSGAITGVSISNGGSGYPTNTTVQSIGSTGSGASLQVIFELGGDGCTAGPGACYPPAVNYTPLYYAINGVAFSRTNPSNSLFPVAPGTIAPATGAGNILVRMVNAGLKMHVPSIVGSQVPGQTGGSNPVVTGFQILAEDGHPLPGVPKVKSDVFMAAGKTFDVMINGAATSGTLSAPTYSPYPAALPVYDRELSLSGNSTERDAGMLAYISINGAGLPVASGTGVFTAAVANPDTYNALVAGQALTVADPLKGVIANDINVYGVKVATTPCSGPAPTTPTASCSPAGGTLALSANGTFTYVPNSGTTSDWFVYQANGNGPFATVTIGPSNIVDAAGVVCNTSAYTSNTAKYLAIKTPGILAGCTDGANLPLTVATSTVAPAAGLTVIPDANGGFTATASGPGAYTFTFQAQNTLGKLSAPTTVTVNFPVGSKLQLNVVDGQDKTTPIHDYRWIIEEDRTFYIDPNCITNPPAAGCPTSGSGIVPTLGTNFHTSYMPYVAQGCTGPYSCEQGQTVLGAPAVCDVGNGVCRTTGNEKTVVMPGDVPLDPTKHYYISVLPGDAANPFSAGYTGGGCQNGSANATSAATCGHGMGGAPIHYVGSTWVSSAGAAAGQSPITVLTQPSPYPPGKLSVFVFEDDFPLNGEQDGGGGIDVLSPNEPGLGGFQLHLWDAMGGNGDFTGQMTYDMFNQPLTNSLAGTVDPNNGNNACPITTNNPLNGGNGTTDPTATGITGMIVTCPKYESDGVTLSPLAGQAVIANLMPGRWGVIATPAADRIARGEEWLQTNTLDGQKAHDVFTRIGEPSYFQEFGPASYHVSIGFANPAIINARHKYVCNGTDPNISGSNCNNTLTGIVTSEHLSRTPDERLYSSSTHDAYYWSQCYVSFGDPDGEDFAFTKCNADGTFTLTGLPDGDWRVTVFDQWNDLLVDGLSTPIALSGGSTGATTNMGDVASTQWQTNLYTRTFIDDNKDGISQAEEAGIPFANVAVRLRDGSLENLLVTDFTGTANFNETFPLFSWYTVETDVTRYKNTGTHVVYDVGGPDDGSASCGTAGYPPCGSSVIGKYLANTAEIVSVPTNLRVPGAVYCAGADCIGKSIQNGAGTSDPPSACTTNNSANPPTTTCTTQLSSGRIDPPWVGVEGWQGFPGQNNFLEFGKEPYVPGENGGIKGHVIYASTRPFDDPQQLVQTQWEPLVPHVTINLYSEGLASDGITPTRTLVDTTQTSSFDDWAQGFHVVGGTAIPNMSCPGQGASSGAIPDLFYFSLYNQPNYLDFYNNVLHGTASGPTPLPYNSQFKCYDGMHDWNQLQPAPYDGMYQFPSVTSVDPVSGKPTGTNCTICQTKGTQVAPSLPSNDLYYGLPQLPSGKYVVEVVLPPGYELVKEEDKNILIGDNYIAPVTQQIGGLGDIFIVPDQASVASNSNNVQNPTQSLGTSPVNGIVPGFIPEPTWPCVGEARVVPDYISLYPGSKQVAPFAGATRNLCDRKEVTLDDQAGAIAKFYIYTSTHIASKFTGGITDDYTSEFDPFSPQFGEKFAPPTLPVSIKDWAGNEISRVYADQWGTYDGMTYSTWEVNPPNPTGYAPTMMVFCMNDPGPILDPGGSGQMITDPLYTPGYSQFCYELPFMPGTTQYLDTPVVPTSAFAGAGYNNVDCAYPDATPAIAEVDGDQIGPWIQAPGSTLTITSLGAQTVPNYAYSGPAATAPPYNQKTITRTYNFGTCTLSSGACTNGASAALKSLDGSGAIIPLNITGWSPTQITATVPPAVIHNPHFPCAVQQQAQYGGPNGTTVPKADCGQLVITAANGKQSIDAVTVTVGGKAPTHVAASGTIQSAIDAAAPGDLIIVDPTCNSASGAVSCQQPATGGVTITGKTTAAHNELLLMWKPVRLQGVGAASSIINANTHPAGKLDVWREQVNCLFGLNLSGTPISTNNPYDPTGVLSCPGTGWKYFNKFDGTNAQVDPLPGEAVFGWDATLNGNLAQLLQEPSLMGALEGAGITVLSKGVNFTTGGLVGQAEGTFPVGTTLLTGPVGVDGTYVNGTGDANPLCKSSGTNPFPSNYMCNPSSIDGIGITDSSQGGGGIFVHAWAHNLQIANNRIISNAGTLSGGINLGQGEFAPQQIQGAATVLDPGSCVNVSTNIIPANAQLPYCANLNVNIHNNDISLNSSTGDELFSATPAGAGGVSLCTGTDYYKFNYNWVCGNLSSGDGGGVGHLGFSYDGDIEHNSILFNQSLNPTIPANGGGIVVMGTPDIVPPCGTTTDQDCVAAASTILPSDGIGPNLVINANVIMGNAAESGSGGGLRLQNLNGSEVLAFPNTPSQWYAPSVTNNIIADNVAGWDGAGISLLDALKTNIINNTIVSNSTTASAGILFTTIGAPLASSEGTNCIIGTETSCPQIAGLVSVENSSVLMANLPATITCPKDHYQPGTSAKNGTCKKYSYPQLANNIFWQNSAYYIGVGAMSAQYQQNVVSLYNAFTSTLAPTQPQADTTVANGAGITITGGTGACVAASYWDIGVRGDTAPNSHDSGVILSPMYSVITDAVDYPGLNNLASNPNFASQYCDGSRTPPEFGASGWSVPAGISDATVPNPIFNLTPVATVDEGNNWINMRWGPLSLSNPTATSGTALGNYSLTYGSPAIDYVPNSSPTFGLAPSTDFFGMPRPDPNAPSAFDVGAVEYQGSNPQPTLTSIAPNTAVRGTSVTVTLTGTNLTDVTTVNVSGAGFTVSGVTVVNSTTVTATFTIAIGANATTRNVTVTASGLTSNSVPFTVTAPPPPTLTSITPTTGVRGTNVGVTLTGTNLTGATWSSATVSNYPNITFGAITVNAGGTSGTATLAIAAGTTLAAKNLSVTTAGGTSGTVAFTVTGATVTISAPSPALNTGGTSTKSGTITVKNTATGGTAGPFTFTANPTIAKTGGTGNGTFAIVAGGTCVSGAVVNSGGQCTIKVQYSGESNTATANAAVTITGTGLATPTMTGATFAAN